MTKKTIELRYDNLHFLLEPTSPAIDEMRNRSQFTCIDACLSRVGKDNGVSKVYKDTFGIKPQEVLKLMKSMLNKYDAVIVYDMITNGSVTLTSDDINNPKFEEYDGYGHTYYIKTAYGVNADEEKAIMDAEDAIYDGLDNEKPVDLEKEKWDNYYGDFNQCGIRIDYN